MPKTYTRRNTNRIPQHNYSTPAQYFITICTENRQQLFGTIKNDQMILNAVGNMIDLWWQKIFEKYGHALIDEYAIMPNHIHGIINIVGAGSSRPDNNKIIGRDDPAPTIGNIIAYFKYQTTKQINESQNTPGKKIWQRNYHDHIIRNDRSLDAIREYIANNPVNWEQDIDNLINL
ncbi:MAG: transposase [Candidatus Omnitrophica bacterium]|nr:transposase [Candidatus Omnitrophota bacterium]